MAKFKLDKDAMDLEDIKMDIKFDIRMLNSIIGYLYKGSNAVTRKSLSNAHKLFKRININIYKGHPNMEARIKFIIDTLEAKLVHGFESEDIVINYCRPDMEDQYVNDIIKNLPAYTKLNYNEIKSISKAIEDRLMFLYVLKYKDIIYETVERLDTGDYDTYKQISDDMYRICNSYILSRRKAIEMDTENSIALSDDDFEDKIATHVNSLKDPAKIVKTGIRCLNEILGGGYAANRLYIYMGLPSGFKSGILLKSIVDAKLYNSDLVTKNPDKIPTALLVTMENDIEETIERLFNMVGDSSDIRNFTPKQVIKILKNEGKMKVTEDNRMDIVIKFYPNRSISTQDLYNIIEDLDDDGREVVTLVLDYIKRIRPTERAADEKEELKNITNELKSLAMDKKISVITAHQLNREAARNVDSAMQANKADLARYVGRANVGSAWEVMENADCTIIINKERKRKSDQLYLTFMMVKQRYRNESQLTYFNHPFVTKNTMRLQDDLLLEMPVSELSLANEFVDASDETTGEVVGGQRNYKIRMDLSDMHERFGNNDEEDSIEYINDRSV